jgi:hypothetical protein
VCHNYPLARGSGSAEQFLGPHFSIFLPADPLGP